MNLAEIRKKAQQEKEALQAAMAELGDEAVESPGGTDYADDFGGMAFDEDEAFDEADPSGDGETFAPEEPASAKVGESLIFEEDQVSPEDIFPESLEDDFEVPATSGPDIALTQQRVLKSVTTPVIEEKESSSFDPLRIMLEGRARAGQDEDAFIGSAADLEIAEADSQELLCFRVGSEEYALNIMEIKEIIKPREVTEVPRVPSFVSGVLSLRGIIIPVFDMSARLGLSKAESSGKERIIVVKNGEEGFSGILVDEVVQVVRIEDRYLEPPPTVLEGIDRDFVSGIGRYHGRMLILLNMNKILDITLY